MSKAKEKIIKNLGCYLENKKSLPKSILMSIAALVKDDIHEGLVEDIIKKYKHQYGNESINDKMLTSYMFENVNALYASIANNNPMVMNILLKLNANIDSSSLKYTDLLVNNNATMDPEIMKFLLKNGATTVLNHVSKLCPENIVKSMIKDNNFEGFWDKIDRFIKPEITVQALNAFIEQKGDINAKLKNGDIPISTITNNAKLLEYLIGYGADVNLVAKNGNSSVLFAIKSNNFKLLNILLKLNANLNVPLPNDTKLHEIIDKSDNCEIMKILCQNGKNNFLELLLKNKADINFKDSSGHTPFYYAKDCGLSARMIKKYATLESLSENTSGDLLNKLLTKCKTNVVDTNQKEELHDKVKNGLEEVLKNKAIYEILNIAANSEYEITFLSQRHNSVGGFNSPYDKNTFVFKACESSKISIIDTIVHEFTHLLMSEIFKNNSKPYYKTNNKNELFINLAKQSIEACPEAFNSMTNKEFYSENEYPCELIAYYFGALAKDILSGSKILAKTFGSYSNLVVALTESMQVVNEKLKSSDLLTTLDYHSDCFDGFFEEMLGMNSIKNSDD